MSKILYDRHYYTVQPQYAKNDEQIIPFFYYIIFSSLPPHTFFKGKLSVTTMFQCIQVNMKLSGVVNMHYWEIAPSFCSFSSHVPKVDRQMLALWKKKKAAELFYKFYHQKEEQQLLCNSSAFKCFITLFFMWQDIYCNQTGYHHEMNVLSTSNATAIYKCVTKYKKDFHRCHKDKHLHRNSSISLFCSFIFHFLIPYFFVSPTNVLKRSDSMYKIMHYLFLYTGVLYFFLFPLV